MCLSLCCAFFLPHIGVWGLGSRILGARVAKSGQSEGLRVCVPGFIITSREPVKLLKSISK